MNEREFDETYNIREVLDDVLERVAMREKLIQTAKQFASTKKDERFNLAIRQFEGLMADFLRLYQPILERLRGHKEYLQKELSGLRLALNTTTGMLEVSRGVDGLSSRVPRLEADVAELENLIKEKSKVAEKIDDLFNKVKNYAGIAPRQPGMAGPGVSPASQDSFEDFNEGGKETGLGRKTGLRT